MGPGRSRRGVHRDRGGRVLALREQMQIRGPELDVEGCIDAVIGWHHDCDIQGANAAVCQQAVGITMFHCLKGADRTAECQSA